MGDPPRGCELSTCGPAQIGGSVQRTSLSPRFRVRLGNSLQPAHFEVAGGCSRPKSEGGRRFDQCLALVGSESADTTGLGDRQFFEEFRGLH